MLNPIHGSVQKRKEEGRIIFCSVSFASSILNMCQTSTPILQGRGGGLQRQRSVLKRGGGGGGGGVIFHSPICIPLLTFSKMSFELFVGTSKPLCNNHRVECVRSRFVTMHQ